ncbi:MAG: ZIP family metal transporter [Lachnospiraceae bacterium]|nr:ZIP family metal transporter [Lachnospiraceae bacterium]
MTALWGLLIPFIGTSAGAACVFLLKDELKPGVQKLLLGFASGVMVAASVWSLLIPAMNMSEPMGKWAFIPAAVGLLLGMAFLLVLDKTIPHLHLGSDTPEGPKKKLDRSTMLLLAVTLHNIPEGMAVGVVFAGVISGSSEMTIAGAIALAVGIAIQNFPEGAVISLPLKSETGMKSGKAFIYGVLSGIVEPVAALATVLISNLITPILPYVLAFAAGSMLYVVVEELIPEASEGDHSNIGTIAFAIGFVLMMVLDVALG